MMRKSLSDPGAARILTVFLHHSFTGWLILRFFKSRPGYSGHFRYFHRNVHIINLKSLVFLIHALEYHGSPLPHTVKIVLMLVGEYEQRAVYKRFNVASNGPDSVLETSGAIDHVN